METFVVFIVLGLFIVLTVSLRFIPSEGFGVLEQMGKIHVIYQEPGLHFVMPFFQKMYLYQKEATLDFNELVLSPENGMHFKVTISISHVITDIKSYHLAMKNMNIQIDLMKHMESFVSSGQYHPNTMKAELNDYLVELFTKTTTYPFAVSNIDVLELDPM